MILIVKKKHDRKQLDELMALVAEYGLQAQRLDGFDPPAIALLGDASAADVGRFAALDIVLDVIRMQDSCKLASRRTHPLDTVIDVAGRKFGGGDFQFIAGPCTVESRRQIVDVAQAVQAAGATLLRGGAFKPRSSPYSFQGLGAEGLEMLLEAKRVTGLPIVSEITSETQLDLFCDVDVIQVGARNMQNFELLKRLGGLKTPILLKRGLSATVEDWLMSAEYILSLGNPNVILCERGIRTFENSTRSTLDLASIPVLRERTHLPIIVDPSHAAGRAALVAPLSMAAAAVGADGIMVEVHNAPSRALCDGAQALRPSELEELVKSVSNILSAIGKRQGK